MIANQMEFGIAPKPTICRRRPQRKLPGARWWFDQMHQAVDQIPTHCAARLKRIKQADFAFPGARN